MKVKQGTALYSTQRNGMHGITWHGTRRQGPRQENAKKIWKYIPYLHLLGLFHRHLIKPLQSTMGLPVIDGHQDHADVSKLELDGAVCGDEIRAGWQR